MAYLVLARKYRPRRFDDMVGQEHVARTLGHALDAGRVHHAYLFSGIRGLGKTTAARIVARALVCEDGPRRDPCDDCEGCRLALEGGHPDIVEIDGASHNKVDDVRDLRERVYYMPQLARRKVYIIDEVHMLSTSAFNALLKTLEEPPEHVHFLFATTEVHKLPATILSRVCRLDFRRVAEGQLAEHLASVAEREGISIEPGALRLVARASEGSVRDAMTLLDQVIAFASEATITEADAREVLGLSEPERIADLVDAFVARDPARALEILDAILAAGREAGAVAVQLLEHLRTLAIFVRCGPQALEVTDAERSRLADQAEGLGAPSWVQGWFDRLAHTLSMLAGHPAPRLLLEMAVLDLSAGEPLEDVLRLAERLVDGPAAQVPPPQPRRAAPGPAAPARTPAARGTRREPRPSVPEDDPDRAQLSALLAGALSDDGDRAGRARASRTSRRRGSATPPADDDDPDGARPSGANTPEARSQRPQGPAPSPTAHEAPGPAAAALSAEAAPLVRPPGWQEWELLVGRCLARDTLAGSVVREVGFGGCTAGAVELWARPDDFAREQLATAGPVASIFARFLSEIFGGSAEVRWVDRPPRRDRAPSLAMVEAEQDRAARAAARERALRDPALERVLEAFEGELVDAEPDDDAAAANEAEVG